MAAGPGGASGLVLGAAVGAVAARSPYPATIPSTATTMTTSPSTTHSRTVTRRSAEEPSLSCSATPGAELRGATTACPRGPPGPAGPTGLRGAPLAGAPLAGPDGMTVVRCGPAGGGAKGAGTAWVRASRGGGGGCWPRRMAARAAAVGRWDGSLARQAATMAQRGSGISGGRVGVSVTWRCTTASACSPVNGGVPVISSYSRMPQA